MGTSDDSAFDLDWPEVSKGSDASGTDSAGAGVEGDFDIWNDDPPVSWTSDHPDDRAWAETAPQPTGLSANIDDDVAEADPGSPAVAEDSQAPMSELPRLRFRVRLESGPT